ncbi:unnamed protein product [Rotaria sordida]|uniref:G-protein coupled receptors family 1 profile domain-containing protein n=1 Tax=Rotaria sordida TaxID=392033 RepID=A0A818XJW9_9BILA|nr:unnamed protein product [Rotaria sordida]CAF3739671.1 unnamed protein product [Rotaria sordida]
MVSVPDFCHNTSVILNEISYQYLSECWAEWRISEYLRIYLPLIILPISLISNCLSFSALRSRHMRGTATAFFMLVLSVLDPLVLLTKHLVYFPTFLSTKVILCKFIYFLIYVVGYTNVWILVIMTADKFFAVWFPLKVAYFCTITRAKYVCIFLLITTSIISFHHFWTIKSFPHPKDATKGVCFYDMSHYSSIQHIWRYIDFIIWCFLPFILISILSMLIILKLRQKQNHLHSNIQKIMYTNMKSREVENKNHLNTYKTGNQDIVMRSNQKTDIIRLQHRHITFMLLAVAGVFLLCTLPNSIYFVLEIRYGFNKQPTVNDYYQWLRYRRLTILTILMYQLSDLQHAANFFIYLLASGKFRQSVLNTCVSIIHILSALLTCSYHHRTNSKQNRHKRHDNGQYGMASHPSASEMLNIIRSSRDTSNKSQQAKVDYNYQAFFSKSTTTKLL